MSEERPSKTRMRSFVTALAVYFAGAWACLEVVDFIVGTYGLDRLFLDGAVLLVVSGGVTTTVLAWYHGKPGRQQFRISEKFILTGIALATLAGLIFIASLDPLRHFNNRDGFRLIVELRGAPPGHEDLNDYRMGPLESTVMTSEAMYNLEPDFVDFAPPGIEMRVEGIPFMLRWPAEDEYVRTTVILPKIPLDVRKLIDLSDRHDKVLIETAGLFLHIDRPIHIFGGDHITTIRVDGPYLYPPVSE